MARQLRIEYEGATYHILARGNRKQAIFCDDRDREQFLRRVGIVCRKTGWEVWGFVLMLNHFHMILHTPNANLVEGMTWFQNAYTRYFNSRHRQWGRLFGDRYKSIVVEEERSFDGGSNPQGDYLSRLIDYVHLNPARAGLIDPSKGNSLLKYRWSSLARGYAVAFSKRPEWLKVETGLSLVQCGDTVKGRRAYVARLDDRLREEKTEHSGGPNAGDNPDNLKGTLRDSWYWGSEAFREWLVEKLEQRKGGNRSYQSSPQGRDYSEAMAGRVIAKGREWFAIPDDEELSIPSRGDLRRVAIAWAVWETTSVSQEWIAKRLGLRSAPNVSQQLRRFSRLADSELPSKVREWKKHLSKIFD